MEMKDGHPNPNHGGRRPAAALLPNGGGDAGGGGERKQPPGAMVVSAAAAAAAAPWQHHPSSRIYRVSRASGGKDRHSKVHTSKGIRDRRVRLSVSTAIQFYDLQDRLGVDQPSKAIEWLINAASAAIDKLPTLDGNFAPKFDGARADADVNDDDDATGSFGQQRQQQLTKSGCSSTSETSKGSVLSLSRSESRVKARDRARQRAAKEKEKEEEAGGGHSVLHAASFTELLTGATAAAGNGVSIAIAGDNSSDHKQSWNLSTNAGAAADYLGQACLFKQPPTAIPTGLPTRFPSNVQPCTPFFFSASAGGEHSPEMLQLSFMQEHLIPVTAVPQPAAAEGDYNLNFSISTGLAGVNRGTLQSNSHHHLTAGGGSHQQQLQRLLPPSLDGSSIPFFFGPASTAAAGQPPAMHQPESQFTLSSFDGRLQLWDGLRHASDMKDHKGKN